LLSDVELSQLSDKIIC